MTCPRFPLVLLLAAATLGASCGQDAPDEVESKTVVPVTVTPVATGTLRATIHATGVVTPAPGAELVVVAPETARIAEVPRAEGETVRRGDLLVRFDIPSAAADVASKRAEVARAEAHIETARANQQRERDLFDRGVAARKDAEDAGRELADAEATLVEARAGLAAAQAVGDRAAVHATFDGIVSKRLHNPGDLVEAAAGDPVLRVVDPRRLEIVASIPVADVARIVIGAAAHLEDAPDTTLKVVSRPASVDPGTSTVPVRLALASPTRLPSGAPVQVVIDAEERRDAIVVPVGAIVRDGAETAVFVVNDGKAERRAVETGISDGRSIEVRSGLKVGDRTITSGQAGLPDGATVRVTPPTR